MRQLLPLLCLLITTSVFAQTTYVPDDNFEAYLEANGAGNGIPNDDLASTPGMQVLPFLNIQNQNIADLTGIEVMIGLFTIIANGNLFTTLDVSNNLNVNTIIANNNPNLTTFVTVPGNNIVSLNLSNCALTQLDAGLLLNIETLDVSNNMITSLDLISNSMLDNVYVQNNALTFLNVANAMNGNILDFNATGNPNLTCINVDNASAGYLVAWAKDVTASFGEHCYDTFVPDDNFENYLETHDAAGNMVPLGDFTSMGNGIDNDDHVQTSRISGVTSLNISASMIADITGIEDFAALEVLDFSGNGVGNFDLSNNIALRELYCASNGMSSINIAANINLEILDCSDNSNLTIDVSNNINLKELNAANNGTTSLALGSNTKITELNIGSNNIASFNFAPYTTLEILDLSNNSNLYNSTFTTLTSLKALNVNGVGINSLDVSTNLLLETLALNNASGFYLDLSANTALTSLSAREADLSGINMQNGNNANITFFDTELNSSTMNCIMVDDPNASYLNTWNVDSNVVFTLDCSLTNIPDSDFENYLETHDAAGDPVPIGDPTSLGNGIANDNSVFTYRIETVTSLDISNQGIGEVIGIQEFTALEILDCSGNFFNDLIISNLTNLRELYCHSVFLPVLDVSSNTNLEKLIMYNANCSNLTLGQNTALTELNVRDNSLSTFNTTHLTALENLNYERNSIFSLDVSSLSNLKTLNANDNSVTSLNLSNNLLLESLLIDYASGFDLDLSSNTALTYFSAYNSDLSGLNMQNGNNANVTYFDARLNVFNCIQVDDPSAPYLVMWQKDAATIFSLDCRETFVPDDNFENYLETHDASGNTVAVGDATSMGNGIANDNNVYTSRIETVTNLDISAQSIADITGIQDFIALTTLLAQQNSFASLDATPLTNLQILNVSSNGNFIAIDLNNLASLDNLNVAGTKITALDLSTNTALRTIRAFNISSSLSGIDFTNNIALEFISIQNSGFNGYLDLSQHPNVRFLIMRGSNFEGLNFQNGANTNVVFFDTTGNPNLTCVLVDDETYSNTNWTEVDMQTSFNETSCGQYLECPEDITVEKDAGSCEAAINVMPPTVYGDSGTAGTALNFDGANDRLTVASGFANDLSEITIEVKAYFDAIGGWDTLLNYTSWASGYLHFQLNPSGNLGWSVNGNSPTDHYVDLGLQPNTWYNLAVSYSATDKVARFYLNGVLQAERTYTTAIPLIANREFTMGAWNGSRLFDGSMDDFRIWNTVRTEAEIQSGLDIPLSGNESGLIAYYNFNEGQACADNSSITTVSDLTGNYNATLNNFDLTDTASNCSSNFVNGVIQDYLLVNDYNNATLLNEAFPVGTTNVTWTLTDPQNQMSQCMQTITVEDMDGSCADILVSPKVFLQGALLDPNTGEENLMRDDLRVNALLPTTSPYDTSEANGVIIMPSGQDAIVDWVLVELRDLIDNTIVSYSRSALLQRDGDVVDIDGTSALSFSAPADSYYVAVKHRNHLGVMSNTAIALNSTTTTVVDFTDATNPITYGTNAQTTYGMPANTMAMWAGNANADTEVVFLNTGAESVDIKQTVLDVSAVESPFGASVFYKPAGYYDEDINMDGEVIFLNAGNELLFVKDNILAHPDNQIFNSVFYKITQQLP